MTFNEETAAYLAHLRRIDGAEGPTHGIFAGVQACQAADPAIANRDFSGLVPIIRDLPEFILKPVARLILGRRNP